MLVCGCRAQSSTHSLQGILLSHYTEQASRCIMMMTTKSLPPKTNKHRAMHFCVFMSSPRAVQTLLEYSFAIILHQPSLHPLPRPPLPVWLCGCSTLALCLSKRFTVSFSYHSYSLSLQSRDMGKNWP